MRNGHETLVHASMSAHAHHPDPNTAHDMQAAAALATAPAKLECCDLEMSAAHFEALGGCGGRAQASSHALVMPAPLPGLALQATIALDSPLRC